MLTRDAILNAADLKTEAVPVPEWGGDVLVRGLTGVSQILPSLLPVVIAVPFRPAVPPTLNSRSSVVAPTVLAKVALFDTVSACWPTVAAFTVLPNATVPPVFVSATVVPLAVPSVTAPV